MEYKGFFLLVGLMNLILIDMASSAEVVTAVEQSMGTPPLYNCMSAKRGKKLLYSQMLAINPPNISNVSYILHTAGNGTTTVKNVFKLSSPISELLLHPLFIKRNGFSVIIHGYTGSQESLVITQGTVALLKRGGVNVFSLDTQALLNDSSYLRASTIAQFIGVELGRSLAEYVKAGNSASNIHLMGHSLGAHMGGFAGKEVTYLTGSKIGRVSGLDPAGPCFGVDATERLTDSDADFVDVIHSDAANRGIVKPIGHADFYPNGGQNQPNSAAVDSMENHRRAWRYFMESILNPKNFLSAICSTWRHFNAKLCLYTSKVYMGYDTPFSTRGIYFLKTTGTSLYGLGDRGAEPYSTAG